MKKCKDAEQMIISVFNSIEQEDCISDGRYSFCMHRFALHNAKPVIDFILRDPEVRRYMDAKWTAVGFVLTGSGRTEELVHVHHKNASLWLDTIQRKLGR